MSPPQPPPDPSLFDRLLNTFDATVVAIVIGMGGLAGVFAWIRKLLMRIDRAEEAEGRIRSQLESLRANQRELALELKSHASSIAGKPDRVEMFQRLDAIVARLDALLNRG